MRLTQKINDDIIARVRKWLSAILVKNGEDNKMKEYMKTNFKSIGLYVIFIVLMILVISLKTNYYIDEIYSYGLSNYTGDGIDMSIEYNKTYTPGASVYWDYMQVQKGERFDYTSVWDNQTNDVHPPFYYVILHTICSIFPNTYSKWYAGSINIVFAMLTLFVMRKIISLLTNDKYIKEILSFSFILMTGILLAVSYFRMYLMAMFWITLLTYLFMKQLDKKADARFYGMIYLVTTAGALTHYYVIVYAVFLSFVYGIYLLWNKRIKEVVLFCVTMALAGGTSLAIFPAMIQHIFFGYRGTEAIGNFVTVSGYWDKLKNFFDVLNRQMFGGMLGYMLVALILLGILRYGQSYFQIQENGNIPVTFGFQRESIMKYILIFVPCFLYFMVVSKVTFVGADRYISPIYAIFYAGIMCFTYEILKCFFENRTFVAVSVILTALIVWGSYTTTGWQYLFRDTKTLLTAAEEHSNYDCICVLDAEANTYLLYPEFEEYSNYKSITFISIDEMKENGISKWASEDGVVVSFVSYPGNTEECADLVKEQNGYNYWIKLGTFGYDNTYFFGN